MITKDHVLNPEIKLKDSYDWNYISIETYKERIDEGYSPDQINNLSDGESLLRFILMSYKLGLETIDAAVLKISVECYEIVKKGHDAYFNQR